MKKRADKVALTVSTTTCQHLHELYCAPTLEADGRFRPPKVIPVDSYEINGLTEIDALILTSDLQERENNGTIQGGRLIGEVLAEDLLLLSLDGKLPHPDRIGICLAGDFWRSEDPTKLGGIGDVSSVWSSFAEIFAFVVGVAGNHDLLDTVGVGHSSLKSNCYLLDGNVVNVGGLVFGGVSGIIGSSTRPNRKSEKTYVDLFRQCFLNEAPDIFITHLSPQFIEAGHPGESIVSDLSSTYRPTIHHVGHVHWNEPIYSSEVTPLVINTDGRCIVLMRSGHHPMV